MAHDRNTKTSGTGKAGHRSARWQPRADAKQTAKKHRRVEDRVACATSR